LQGKIVGKVFGRKGLRQLVFLRGKNIALPVSCRVQLYRGIRAVCLPLKRFTADQAILV
jgi:hypothetical protein